MPTTAVRLHLTGANPHPRIVGVDRLPGIVNYFIGSNRRDWHTNIPTYARVVYRDVYPGIDLGYYGTQGHLEYDFIVHPRAKLQSVAWTVTGARDLRLDRHGNLLMNTALGLVREQQPVMYQSLHGVRRPVQGQFVIAGTARVAFIVGRYDRGIPLVVDPVLSYSTYLGGNDTDWGAGIAVDGAGNAYVTGYTDSHNFPTRNALQPSYGGGSEPYHSAAFVSKLDAAGTALVYSTYLGGNGYDRGAGIAVDGAGDAYVTGRTTSHNFPTRNALQPSYGGGSSSDLLGSDAFVSKLDAAGTALVYSTYLGGNSADGGTGIAVDGAGNAYITGRTSGNFPTHNALQPSYGGGSGSYNWDAFVSKIADNTSPPVPINPVPPVPPACAVSAIIAGWSISASICPGKTSATHVSVTPPGALAPTSGVLPLPDGSVSFDMQGGKVHLTRVSIVHLTALHAGSFTFDADGLTVDQDGLAIATAHLHLPSRLSSLSAACGGVTVSNVLIDPAYHLTRGTVNFGGPVDLSVASATINIGTLTFGDDGLGASSVDIALPNIFRDHGSASTRIDDFRIRGDGSVSGTLAHVDVELGEAISGSADNVKLTSHGFKADTIRATIAKPLSFGLTIHGLTYDGRHFGFDKAQGNVDPTTVNLGGGMQATVSGSLYLQDDAGAITFDLYGAASVAFPQKLLGGGTALGSLEIGTIPDHNLRLRNAHVAFTFGNPIPIGETPFALDGFSADVCLLGGCDNTGGPPTTALGGPIYIFQLSASLSDLTPGDHLMKGSITGAASVRGDFGLGGRVGFLNGVVDVDAGICVLLPTQQGAYPNGYTHTLCDITIPNDALTLMGGAPQTPGIYLGLAGQVTLKLTHTARLSIAGAGAIAFNQSEPSARFAARGTLPQGFLLGLSPQFDVSADAYLDNFHTPSLSSVYGLKFTGSGTANLGGFGKATLHVDAFVKQDGTATLINADEYQSAPQNVAPARQAALPAAGDAASGAGLASGTLAAHAPRSSATYLVRVLAGQSDTLLGITYRRGNPALTLVSPSGAVFTPQQRAGLAYYTLNGKATGGVKAAVFYLPHPQGGTWRVRVGNLVGNEAYQVKMYGNKPLPLLSVDTPRHGQTVVATAAHPVVDLTGMLTGVGRGATVSLYAATARTSTIAGRRVPAAIGTPIAARVAVGGTRWHYRWDTALTHGGRYVVVARLNNGVGTLVSATSAGEVRVVASGRPDAPRAASGLDTGRQVLLRWAAPTRSGDVAGYLLRVHDSTMRRGTSTTIDVGPQTTYSLTKPTSRTRETVTVLAYDGAGHLSRATTVAIRRGAPTRPPHPPRARRLGSVSASIAGGIDAASGARDVRPEAAMTPSSMPPRTETVLLSRTLVDHNAHSLDARVTIHAAKKCRATAPTDAPTEQTKPSVPAPRPVKRPACSANPGGCAVTLRPPTGVAPTPNLPVYVIHTSRTPEIAYATEYAFLQGYPDVLTYDGDMKRVKSNRDKACSANRRRRDLELPSSTTVDGHGIPNSCDEYPYASTTKGGDHTGLPYPRDIAQIQAVPETEQSAQSEDLRSLYARLRALGQTTFRVEIDDNAHILSPRYTGTVPRIYPLRRVG